MTVSTKRRRKLQIGDRGFIWWIAPDLDSSDLLLHLCSTDRHLLVRYVLGQPADRRHVIVIGPEFPPLKDAGGGWTYLGTPAWSDAVVTPGLVRQIIEWCLDASKDVVWVSPWGLR